MKVNDVYSQIKIPYYTFVDQQPAINNENKFSKASDLTFTMCIVVNSCIELHFNQFMIENMYAFNSIVTVNNKQYYAYQSSKAATFIYQAFKKKKRKLIEQLNVVLVARHQFN